MLGHTLKRRFAFLAILVVVGIGTPAAAWGGHQEMTGLILAALEGSPLTQSELAAVESSLYKYEGSDTEAYGPAFLIRYLETHPVSAAEIIATYVGEPDWGMDQGLELSFLQALTGGSHGWRHGFTRIAGFRIGLAPERADYYYEQALKTYQQGDKYWAFRFLARSLHYVEDVGQPLHSVPLPVGDLIFRFKFNVKRAMVTAENVHHALEGFVAYAVRQNSPVVVDALQSGETHFTTSAKWEAEHLSANAAFSGPTLYWLVLQEWPQLDSPNTIKLGRTQYAEAMETANGQEILQLSAALMQRMAGSVSSIVRRFLGEVNR